jgi:hypothetical protein
VAIQDYVNASTAIRNDLRFTNDIKAKVEQAVRDTIVATRIVDGFKNPGGSGGGYLKDHAGFPLECVFVPGPILTSVYLPMTGSFHESQNR